MAVPILLAFFSFYAILTVGSCSTLKTTKSFAGANNHYVQTLPVSVQTAYVNQLASAGAKVVRLWVYGSLPDCTKSSTNNFLLDLEPNLGEFYNDTLVALDAVLYHLSKKGIKAIISPHNSNDLNGEYGCDVYCQNFGSYDFYTTDEAWDAYSARLEYILNFESPHFGKKWSQLHEAILAFDIENEPFAPEPELAANNDPTDWLCGHAGYMHDLIGGSGVKIATGGVGGSEYYQHLYSEMPKVVQCDAIDIISVHGYQTEDVWAQYIPSILTKVNGKHVMVEEWGVGSKVPSYYPVNNDQFQPTADLFNKNGVPWLYWEVIPGLDDTQNCSRTKDKCCGKGLDGYEIGPGSKKGNIPGAIKAANTAKAAQDWTGYVY